MSLLDKADHPLGFFQRSFHKQEGFVSGLEVALHYPVDSAVKGVQESINPGLRYLYRIFITLDIPWHHHGHAYERRAIAMLEQIFLLFLPGLAGG